MRFTMGSWIVGNKSLKCTIMKKRLVIISTPILLALLAKVIGIYTSLAIIILFLYALIVSVLEIKKANTKFDYFLIVKQVFLWLSVVTMIIYQLNPLWKLDFIKVATSIGMLIFSLDTLLRIFRKSEYQSDQEQNRWQTFFYFSIFWIGVLITINN